jgi:hypothetical protein
LVSFSKRAAVPPKTLSFFAPGDQGAIVMGTQVLGGGILILFQLLNILIFVPSVPTAILFATILLFALFTFGYLKKN